MAKVRKSRINVFDAGSLGVGRTGKRGGKEERGGKLDLPEVPDASNLPEVPDASCVWSARPRLILHPRLPPNGIIRGYGPSETCMMASS